MRDEQAKKRQAWSTTPRTPVTFRFWHYISGVTTLLLRVARHASRLTILALPACSPAPQVEQREFIAMGTTISIVVADASPGLPATLATIERDIQRSGREWYAWNQEGELAKLNTALAAGRTFEVSAELADLLQRARDVYRSSEGAFDPAVAPMVELWGFNDAERTAQSPGAARMRMWQAGHATFADLRIDLRTVSSVRRDIMLDLGAIGKGYVVDRAVAELRRNGVHNALVNAGGNLRAVGRHPQHPWRIAIRNPRADGAIATIELQSDESVSTSGDYERAGIVNGKRAHHLLDPRTGEPALHTAAVTVFAHDATLADAASTALFIAGADRWLQMAKTLQIQGAIRFDAGGHVQATRSLKSRLHVSERTLAVEWVDL